MKITSNRKKERSRMLQKSQRRKSIPYVATWSGAPLFYSPNRPFIIISSILRLVSFFILAAPALNRYNCHVVIQMYIAATHERREINGIDTKINEKFLKKILFRRGEETKKLQKQSLQTKKYRSVSKQSSRFGSNHRTRQTQPIVFC